MADNVYWVGDNHDNKSVCIKRVIYVKGDKIPAEDVAQKLLDEWKKNGLIAVGDKAAPVVIIDTDAVKNLKTEIAVLKRDLERIPGLEREITDLKKAAEKAKGGTKAKASKAKDAHIKELEENAIKQSERIKQLEGSSSDRIKELELDVQEKAALIDKLNVDLEEATAPDKGGDGADENDKPDDSGAGPGGSK